MSKKVDFIIVGRGLSGSSLAYKLMERGYRVVAFDKTEKNKSSLVAPGIFNPITGKKMVKTWLAYELWDNFLSFYREAGEKINKKLVYLHDHYRPFGSKQDCIYHLNESSIDKHKRFVRNISADPLFPDLVYDEFGGIELNESGYIDVPAFIEGVGELLREKGEVVNEYLDPAELIVDEGSVQYKEIIAKRLVFCDGWKPGVNPYFDWLPFKPVKGELLHLHLEKPLERIYNRGVFVMPHHDGNCRVGSTYDNYTIDSEPSEKGLKHLTGKFSELIKQDYKVVNHKAGIRPASHDRRPYVGFHPKHETIGLLNGLGTKGVTLAPYFAENLVQFIEKKEEIKSEVSLKRCYSLYLNSVN